MSTKLGPATAKASDERRGIITRRQGALRVRTNQDPNRYKVEPVSYIIGILDATVTLAVTPTTWGSQVTGLSSLANSRWKTAGTAIKVQAKVFLG